MSTENSAVELYRKHRPAAFKQVVGQPEALRIVMDMVKNQRVPHALLFTGPSGCGKTTLARILKTKLNCGDTDFVELNCADFRGIDMVRDIRKVMGLAPISGTTRIWLIDEAHQMMSQAQNAFLKMLEDTPPHVYFFLATTDPQKLLNTIRTRCTEVKVKSLSPAEVTTLVTEVAKLEGFKVPQDTIDAIIEHAEGSARKALVLLNQVIHLPVEDQVDCIVKSDCKTQGIEIARALFKPGSAWSDVAKILKSVDEEPETIRHIVLGYATNVLCGGGKLAPRAFLIIDCFSKNFFDSKRAGLAAACYEVVTTK